MGYAASMADGRRGIDRDAPFHGMTPRWSNAVDGVDPNGVFSATTPFQAGMRERDSAYVSQCHADIWSGDPICVGAMSRPPGQGRGSTAVDRGRRFDARLGPSFADTVPETVQSMEMDADAVSSAHAINSCRPRSETVSFGGTLFEGTVTDPMIHKRD